MNLMWCLLVAGGALWLVVPCGWWCLVAGTAGRALAGDERLVAVQPRQVGAEVVVAGVPEQDRGGEVADVRRVADVIAYLGVPGPAVGGGQPGDLPPGHPAAVLGEVGVGGVRAAGRRGGDPLAALER